MKNSNKNIKKPKVYLAGKITKNHWRDIIVGAHGRNAAEYVCMNDYENYYYKEEDIGNVIITGPHSVGCDHSCFHYENRPHASVGFDESFEDDDDEDENSCWCWGNSDLTRDDVVDACCQQIDRSDVVFTYIDDIDAYGTLTEIGYAKGKCYIYIVFKNKEIAKKLWFAARFADKVYYCDETELMTCFNDALYEYKKMTEPESWFLNKKH